MKSEICAELEVCHSRVVAPTRRVALGSLDLPEDYGPVLLGCVAGWFAQGQDDEFFSDAAKLLAYVSTKTSIPQPHMRYRFQQDLVGLLVSSHQIREEVDSQNGQGHWRGNGGNGNGGNGLAAGLEFVSDMKNSTPAQHVLGALYAAYRLEDEAHWQSCEMIEMALEWAVERPLGSLKGTKTRLGITGVETTGGTEPERSELLGLLVKGSGVLEADGRRADHRNGLGDRTSGNRRSGGYRSGGYRSGSHIGSGGQRTDGRSSGQTSSGQTSGGRTPSNRRLSSLTLAHRWAMKVLEFEEAEADTLSEAIIQDRFRTLLREAHPDSGGNPKEAPTRISDLSEARRLLIG